MTVEDRRRTFRRHEAMLVALDVKYRQLRPSLSWRRRIEYRAEMLLIRAAHAVDKALIRYTERGT